MKPVKALLLCLALAANAAWAQQSTGKILGTITDDSGGVVPAAKIVATSPSLPRGLETTSDSTGKYQFPIVPIGTYAVTVSKQGFNTFRQQQVEVGLGSEIAVNAKLSVGRVTETVEVTESAVSLDTTSSRTATNIAQQQIVNLPQTSRNFNSLLAMAPGVRSEVKNGTSGVGGIQVDGASGSENAFYIDGVEVSDLRRGSLRAQNAVPFEMVQEIQVKSGGFEAEFGGATGGVVTVATRGGSNQYHGEALFAWTNSGMNAGDRGYWQRSPLNADRADFFKPKEDDYHIYYPGFRVGGPFPALKNKLFFFGSLMPEMEHTDRKISYTSGDRQWTQDYKRWYGQSRIDFQPSAKIQSSLTYLWSPVKRTGSLPNRDARVAAPTNDLSVQGGYTPAQAFTASTTYSATSRLIFSFRYGYRYHNDKDGNYGLSTAPYVVYQTASTAGGAGVPSSVAGGTGYSNVSSTLGSVKDITTRHNVYVDVTHIANIAGQQHTFKGGWSINKVGNDVATDYTNGYFRIFWGDNFSRGSVTNQKGQYGYYIWEDGVRLNNQAYGRNQGMYFQDSWRVRPNITINAGIRFENEFLPPYTPEVNGVKIANPVSFGWTDKIAPRLGAAWDIKGDGKWKLSGSFGYFYDVMKYELARGSFGGDYWWSHVYKLDNPNVFGLSKANPGALGAKIISYNNRTLPINAAGELEGIDPGIKPYTSREFTANFEHALSSRVAMNIRYTHKDLLKAIEDIGVLDSEDNEVYLIGNPGFGQTRDTKTDWGKKTPNGQEYLVPKAIRKYDAVEFRVQGQWKQYFLLTSYTWSRLNGNYSGAANSDESGRSDPGVSRAFDLPYYYFDASGSQKNVTGPLGTDRPHTLKIFGSYDLKSKIGSTNFGLTQVAYSGSPDSTTVIYLSAPTFPNGRGDMGRTPVYTQTDLAVSHSFKLGEKAKAKFEVQIRNLFNQASVIQRVTQINRAGAISEAKLPVASFFKGYTLSNFVSPANLAGNPQYQPIYGLPGASYRNGGGPGTTYSSAWAATLPNFGAYQDFRVLRLGLRFIF